METVIMIFDGDLGMDLFQETLSKFGVVVRSTNDRLIVEAGSSWIAVDCSRSIKDDFDDDEISFIQARVVRPFFCLLEFNDIRLAEQFIREICEFTTFWIDNDFGWIASCNDVVSMIDQSFDWLRHSPNRA